MRLSRRQLDEKSPYTANLCPLSVWVELAGFHEDFGETIGELVETMLRSAAWQRTTEHLSTRSREAAGWYAFYTMSLQEVVPRSDW